MLAILPNWLGDLVMAQPALARLRREGRLVAIGAPNLLELLVDTRQIDEAIPYDRHGRDRGPVGLWRAGRRCAGHAPVQAVAFPPSLRAAVLARLSGARRRGGVGGMLRSALLSEVQPPARPPRSIHLADVWHSLAERDGVPRATGVTPVLEPGPAGRAGLERLRAELELPDPRATCVLAPSATYGATKRWPAEHFVSLARALRAGRGYTPVFVAGPSSDERALCEELAVRTDGVSVAGRTDLPTLAAVLEQAELFVGNDSGPMHLAAAVGTPTVGIFGSTSPRWTAPRGERAHFAGPAPTECSPCFRRSCPYGLECLRELDTERVLEAVEVVTAPRVKEAR